MKPHRRYSTTVNVNIEVDFDDVLPDIPTAALLAELSRRKSERLEKQGILQDELDEAADYLMRGQTFEVLLHLERALPVRFRWLADRVMGVRQ